MANFLDDKVFLRRLDEEQLKEVYAKIIVLNWNEIPIKEIQGKILPGSSLSVDGGSSLRRTCTLSVLADDETSNITDIRTIFSLNKKMKFYTGVKNNIDSRYDSICWFPMGVYVINQCNFTHDTTGIKMSLSCKDKMCLLNGDVAGTLPAQVTFDTYDQVQYDGSITSEKQLFFDIIQTAVANFGGEDISRIFVNDVPLELKQLVHYTGTGKLYCNQETGVYTTEDKSGNDKYWKFEYKEDVGYQYTIFTYPEKQNLVSGVGSTVTSVLDTICQSLGNFEYFYDVNGNFIFQEKKNYLNTSYRADDSAIVYHLDAGKKVLDVYGKKQASNNLDIINSDNYAVDYNGNTKQVYTFEQGSKLISSYSNSVPYTKIKNDFHIWGKNDGGQAIHYHLAIKEKPKLYNTYKVIFFKDADGKNNGRLRLATNGEIGPTGECVATDEGKTLLIKDKSLAEKKIDLLSLRDGANVKVNKHTVIFEGDEVVEYTPSDWRAELYLQGLEAKAGGRRPDIYQQELLDLFDGIYEFGYYDKDKNWVAKGRFKSEETGNPNNLKYFFDYLEPSPELQSYSVDELNPRIYSYQQDNITKLYNLDVPDLVLINIDDTNYLRQQEIREKCEREGQRFSQIPGSIGSKIALGTVGYAASDTMREMLYQYTTFNTSITINSLPIYYLEPNTRISVHDVESNISGDYIIKSFTLPLDGAGTMSIQATQALERV